MPAEENKAIVVRYLEEVWNAGDLAAADEVVAPSLTFRGPTGVVEGLEAFKHYVSGNKAVFPDLHFDLEELIAEGDRAVIHWRMTGTQERDFMGIVAVGQRIDLPGVSILRLSGGKVAEAQLYWDRLNLLEQLRAEPVAP